VALALAALLGSFWSTSLPGAPSVTVGRGLLLAVVVALVYDLARGPEATRRLIHGIGPLVAALAGLLGWIAASALGWGCNCAGSLGGAAEFALACALAAAVCILDVRRAPLIMLAAAGGVLLGGARAAVGFDELSSPLVSAEDADDRLDGVYGNANLLAYALAFSVPALVATCVRTAGRTRAAVIGVLVGTAVLLALTYSRSGILAAVLGGIAAAALAARTQRRAVLVVGVGLATFAIAAAALYPVFQEQRTRAGFSSEARAAQQTPDRSGWDPRAQGLIPSGNAELSNDGPGVLAVRSAARGRGASFPLGRFRSDERVTVNLEVRAVGTPRLVYIGLEDNLRANGPAVREARAADEWDGVRVSWTPTGESPDARIYLWQNTGPGTFQVRDIRVRSLDGGEPSQVVHVPLRLGGSPPADDVAEATEQRFVESRLDGLKLSFDAFRENPIRGIGWETFPAFADERDEWGPIPTHNEYARILAELGLVGALLFLVLVAVIASALAVAPRGYVRAIAGGMLVTGAVGLFFTNGLGVSSASLPLAIAVGVLVATRTRRARGDRDASVSN